MVAGGGKKALTLNSVLFLAKTKAADNERLIQAIEKRDLVAVKTVILQRPEAYTRDEPGDYVPLLLATSLGFGEIVSELITAGANVNARNDDNDTALIIASRKGFLQIVSTYIQAKADLHAKNSTSATALLVAMDRGHQAVATALIAAGADVNAKDKDGMTALMYASRRGTMDLVLHLLSHRADTNAQNANGKKCLCYAVEEGHHEVAMALIQKGNARYKARDILRNLQDVPKLSPQGHWPIVKFMLLEVNREPRQEEAGDGQLHLKLLSRAATEGQVDLMRDVVKSGALRLVPGERALFLAAALNSVDTVQRLVAERIPVDSTDEAGRTALTHAAMHGNDTVVEELVLWGADVNHKDHQHLTPLMWAIKRAHCRAARMLLAHGADADYCVDGSAPPLILAIELNQIDIVDLLLEHQADLDISVDRTSILAWAIRLGHYTIACSLIYHGAEPNDRHAFLTAVEREDVGGLRVLLNNGANPNLVVCNGETALMLACRLGRPLMVNLLMQFEANPNYADRYGNDCILIAALNGHLKIINLLLSYGVLLDMDKQAFIAETLAAAKYNKMQIREAFTVTGVLVPKRHTEKVQIAMGATMNLYSRSKVRVKAPARLPLGTGDAALNGSASHSALQLAKTWGQTVRGRLATPRSPRTP